MFLLPLFAVCASSSIILERRFLAPVVNGAADLNKLADAANVAETVSDASNLADATSDVLKIADGTNMADVSKVVDAKTFRITEDIDSTSDTSKITDGLDSTSRGTKKRVLNLNMPNLPVSN